MRRIVELCAPFRPGVIISLTVAAAATFLGEHYGAPVMLFALLLGLALGFAGEVDACKPGIDLTSKAMLRFGIALLGFRITVWDVAALGWQTALFVGAAIAVTISASVVLARRMGFDPLFGLLSGGATAICGASAAMALSAALPAHPLKERATMFTVVGVSLLSTLTMIAYPPLARWLGLDAGQAGIFVGATIHDVAQVVGAGFAISPEAGETATIVKLMRVAMLAPVIIVAGLVTRARAAPSSKRPPLLPGFVMAFIAIVALNSSGQVPMIVSDAGKLLAQICLVAAIAAVGMKTKLGEFMAIGLRPVVLMFAETLILATLVILALRTGLI